MKPLKTSQQIFALLCAHPTEEDNEKLPKICYSIFSATVFTLLLTAVVSSIAYFVKFVSIDLESSLYALFQIVATWPMLNGMSIVFFMKFKMRALFENLQNVYEKCWYFFFEVKKMRCFEKITFSDKNWNSFEILGNANDWSERLWEIYLKYALGGFFVNTAISSAYSIFCTWRNGFFDANIAYYPYKAM